MKRFFFFLLLAVLVLVAVVLFNTFTFTSKQKIVAASQAVPELEETAVGHFIAAIRYKTISYGDSSRLDTAQFFGFYLFLKQTYPLVHKTLSVESIAKYSLLYRWEGKNPSLKAVVLMAHQDVVPIEEGTEKIWSVDPFAGTIKDNFIWGRGTTDDKVNLIAVMEAAEKMLKKGFRPERTIYFSFGHDEEMGGYGARSAAALLKQRGVQADLVLDEGGIITTDKIPGMTKPVALLGTSEKGFLSLDLTVEINGGHSSMPEKETALDLLTRAIVKLRNNPFEPNFSPSTQGFIQQLGPEMPFMQKMAFANIWLFKPMVIGIYEKSGSGNAMIRTTLVPTIIKAGMKDNVVPTIARATVNLRLLPGDHSSQIIERVKRIIDDERVKVEANPQFISEASEVTAVDSYAYQMVDEAVKISFNQMITSPFLMIGGTDSRYFGEVSKGIVKFSPVTDPIGFHGIDERVSIDSYKSAIWFYEVLMRGF